MFVLKSVIYLAIYLFTAYIKPRIALAYYYKCNYGSLIVFFTKHREYDLKNKPQDSTTLSELEVLGCRW